MKDIWICHYYKKGGIQIKQVFTSWDKKEQSKSLPTVKRISEELLQYDPDQISQSWKHPQEKNPMKGKSHMKKRKLYRMQGAECCRSYRFVTDTVL